MKKSTGIYLACLAMACSSQAIAQEPSLMVEAHDAEGVVVAEAPVGLDSKLRFSAEGVEVYTGEALEAIFHYSALSNISFRYDDGSGAGQLVAVEALRLRNNPVDENLEFIGFVGDPVALSVCGLKGEVLKSVAQWSGEAIDVSSLAPGLYLVKAGQSATFKFIKR